VIAIVGLVSTELPFPTEWNFHKNMEFPFFGEAGFLQFVES
jgi:hypothetical protein